MFWTKGKLSLARLVTVSIVSLIGCSPGQGVVQRVVPGDDTPQDTPPANAGGPQGNGGGKPQPTTCSGELSRRLAILSRRV